MSVARSAAVEALALQAARRAWWKDGLEATAWLAGVGAVAFMLASGSALLDSPADALSLVARTAGLAAATLIMVQVVLIARVPWVERVVGHDRAAATHSRLGKLAFLVLLGHLIIITVSYAVRVGEGVPRQFVMFIFDFGAPMTVAVMAFALFTMVVVTSLVAVRRRWRYETWHVVHLAVYVAIGLAIPHQFINGTTFASGGAAWVYWAGLWTVAITALVWFRFVAPIRSLARHDLRVARVERLADGSAAIWVTGRNLDRMGAQAGQFFLWRFLTPGLWAQAHPFSLSTSPLGDAMRVTVKPLGDHSSRLAKVDVGTRVMTEGPLGTFTLRQRRASDIVLVAAGIGITPMLSLLGDVGRAGACTVIVRTPSKADIPHYAELLDLVRGLNATLYVLEGPRGNSWAPAASPVALAQLAPHLLTSDVYVCGPPAWSRAVLDDAREAGVAEEQLHVEDFAW